MPPYAFILLQASFTDLLLLHTGLQNAQPSVNLKNNEMFMSHYV